VNHKRLYKLAQAHLNWDARRIDFLVSFTVAMIAARSVNWKEIALHMGKRGSYRRIQRFFQLFRPNKFAYLEFILAMLPSKEKLSLVMDRTNWKYGSVHINILLVGCVYQGTVIPLCWMVLDKAGNSSMVERIRLMNALLRVLPKTRIAVFIADREFIGADWLSYLRTQGIRRCIRIRKNSLLENSKVTWVYEKFDHLALGQSSFLKRRYTLMGESFYLAGVKLKDDFLIVACDVKPSKGLQVYGLRWGIETLFGNTKSRGFDFEATHVTHPDKLTLLLGVMSLAIFWALQAGTWLDNHLKPLKLKKHGRFEQSRFRYGLDQLRQLILQHSLDSAQALPFIHLLTCT
jgi:Transposase DDE domain